MFKTHLQWTIDCLEQKGKVSRNSALARHITRLSARIRELKDSGWKIEGEFVKTRFGKDYIYSLTSKNK